MASRAIETQFPGDRPALVMLHGFALDSRMWKAQVAAFRTDYRLLTIDLPGFGAQARENGAVSPAEEVGRAMDVARLGRAHLMASAYGAAVAIDFALQHPGRVASLVLAGPMLLGRRAGIEAWPRCVALAAGGDCPTASEVWLDDALFETLRLHDELYDDVREIVLDYRGGHWTGEVTSTWADPEPFERLKELDIPTLIVSGEQDLPSFALMAEAYAKALPRARREIVKSAGHLVNMEAPAAFNELVRAFHASPP